MAPIGLVFYPYKRQTSFIDISSLLTPGSGNFHFQVQQILPENIVIFTSMHITTRALRGKLGCGACVCVCVCVSH